MIVIVGLGNPGKEYESTYHNLGFLVVDEFAKKFNFSFSKKKFNGLVAEGNIGEEKVVLLKPQTFMNLSGKSVRSIVDFYKINLSNLIVVFDDVDIPLGNIRIRANGTGGSHNGMKSIIESLNNTNFPRLRIGIGGGNYYNLADYVLSKINSNNKEQINEAINEAVDFLNQFITYNCDITKIKKN